MDDAGSFTCVRFIPAPAGNTPYLDMAREYMAVHPRTCGEHNGQYDAKKSTGGSSPHLRGTRSEHKYDEAIMRFIPAPAGNTSFPACLVI